ncbi:hypothetical protein CMEL01_12019 [Colletotrichum melonis]|uniref:Uncharacterized protein n=1 Tax=Colletotrichum melonis TaxID=1209925 RepID=A0AAI9UWH0_9PEZI|nr:hypothetical protein CMEL01_12019 [Colletotrichum melonis]
MAGRPSFANVNTNDTDGMMLTSCTVVYVKTANVKVRVYSLVGNTAKALTSIMFRRIFPPQTFKARGSVRRSLMRSTARARGRSRLTASCNHSNGALCGSVQGYIKGGKARGSRVQVDRRRRRRRRSATCLTASRLVVRAAVGFMGGG